MGDKEATPTEDLDVLLTPVEDKQTASPEEQHEVPMQTGDVNVPEKEKEKSQTTEGTRLDQIIEMFLQLNKKMDSIQEEFKSWNEEMREDRLKREELRKEKTKEIKNDSQPETEEIPNDKTKEPLVVLPEKKTNGNKENTKDKEVEPKKMRRTHPRKLMKTKEEMEMMNHGLMEDVYKRQE